MKKMLILTLGVVLLVFSHSSEKVYATNIEKPVSGIITVLDKINHITIDLNTYCWTTKRVNLREKSNIDSQIIKTLDKRTKLIVISQTDNWTKVKYNKDIYGYIRSDYLRDTELPSLDLTDEEIDLIAKIVWLESRGESDLGSACVVRVIINRLLSIEFSDTIYEVLSDKNEFSTWKLLDTAKPTEREYEIIQEVLAGKWNELDESYVYFSTSPRNKNYKKIGNHYFCPLN